MTGHGAKLPRKQDDAIAALMTCASVEKAAEAIGVHPNTLRRWMTLPEFHAAYNQARREAVRQANARLQQNSGVAATVLLKTMADATTPAAVKVKAAECVLERASKSLEEDDLEVRVTQLESTAQHSRKARVIQIRPAKETKKLGDPGPSPIGSDDGADAS
jgi:transposase-like protein